MDAKLLRQALEKVLEEAILANQTQLLQGVENYADYKYMLGIQHTLTDMKDRVRTEHNKLLKSLGGDNE
jgi:hypothetical protein|tara:strand:+ start:98 stop:304 length:207 start_codon:yes stop_codon:yes gene_type:complete